MYPVVKVYFADMRACGHYVDKKDFVEEFTFAAEACLGNLGVKAEALAFTVLEK